MDKVNTLNKMAQYDFDTPINVTMIFEDDSNDEFADNVSSNDHKYNAENAISMNDQIKTNINAFEGLNVELKSEMKQTDCNITTIQSEENQIIDLNEGPCSNKRKTQTTLNPNTTNVTVADNSEINNGVHNTSERYQEIYNTAELDTYVQLLLNTLSEHIILIMEGYYDYYCKYRSQSPSINIEGMRNLKARKKNLFDLSYSSVVSIILPQEKNENFIDKFIDKTMNEANQVMTWKCGRQHVERVFYEMVEWTRQSKENVSKLKMSNENQINNISANYKESLSKQSKSFNIANPTAAPLCAQNPNKRSEDTRNSTLLFSYGEPGREICINVNTDTLNQISMQYVNNHAKQSPTNEMRQIRYNDNYMTRKQLPLRPPTSRRHPIHHAPHNPYSKNTMNNHPLQRRQPPPYSNQNHYNTNRPTIPAINQYNLNLIRENILRHTMKKNEEPLNTYPLLTSQLNNSNFGKMHDTHNIQRQDTGRLKATTLNHMPVLMSGCCCLCGKFTNARCPICNQYTYCSALCQEMDSGIHKSTCGKF